MKITTFETAQVGDKVWDVHLGWGEVYLVGLDEYFPVIVVFPNGETKTYTEGGLYAPRDANQTLFWDEVKINAPKKPMPYLKVDTEVVVWREDHIKYNRYFTGWCELSGLIMVYDYGATSWSAAGSSTWPNWELSE